MAYKARTVIEDKTTRLRILCKERCKGSTVALAKQIGVPYTTLYNMMTGTAPVSLKVTESIITKLGVNSAWFIEGEGEMYVAGRKGTLTLTAIQMVGIRLDIALHELAAKSARMKAYESAQDELFNRIEELEETVKTLLAKLEVTQ